MYIYSEFSTPTTNSISRIGVTSATKSNTKPGGTTTKPVTGYRKGSRIKMRGTLKGSAIVGSSSKTMDCGLSYMDAANFSLARSALIGGAVGLGAGYLGGVANVYTRSDMAEKDGKALGSYFRAIPENPAMAVTPYAAAMLNPTPKSREWMNRYRDSEDYFSDTWQAQGNNKLLGLGLGAGLAYGVGSGLLKRSRR